MYADLPDSYIFADDIESPVGAKLPLWMLGFISKSFLMITKPYSHNRGIANQLELRNVVSRKKRLASLAEPTLYCHLFRQQLFNLFD